MTSNLSAVPGVRRSAVDLLWWGLSSRSVGLALAAAFVAGLTIGNLLPQLPPDAATDVGERTRWLVTTSLVYGPWGTWFQRLGLFDVAHAPWWKGLLALGLCHALLRLADAVELAWRRASRPLVLPAALPHAVYVSDGAAEKRDTIRRRLASVTDAVDIQEGGDGTTLWRIARRPWSAWAQGLAWLGVALGLLWALFGEQDAWRVGGLSLPPGQPIPLGQGTGLSLLLLPDTDTYQVVWLRGDAEVARAPLADGQPAYYHGIGLHWRGEGPTLTVTGEDAAGVPLTFEQVGSGQPPAEIVHLIFDRDEERTFAVAAQGVALRALTVPDGTYRLEAYRSGEETPFFTATLAGEETWRIDQADYTFTPGRFVRVTAQYTPLFPLLPTAGLLLAVAVGVHLWLPSQAMWLRATPAGKGLWFEWATEGEMPDGWLRDILSDSTLLAEGERDG